MKTIALTLFAAALGCAQNQSSDSTTPPPPKILHRPQPAPSRTPPRIAPKAGPAAENQKTAPSPAQQKAEARSQVQSIPAGAAQVEPNLYRYTDSSGKTWNYRQTPFGISRWEEKSTPAAEAAPAKREPVVVTDLGDSYRFEQKTPFGNSTWVRKKSELTDEEKALAGEQHTPSEPNQKSVNSKPAGNR